ncbi:hypothetical protein A8C56_04865 [Niabella ginsenosidivorans]|uniref:Uncharacterized protein n=1 Tax=Niabella ginsenosidivorans TaxID=1176587 RepID=A0A1A9I1G3_9BACT|nr:hypothetical protein A8C56_04865 [Niabella ginsenosidivorans]
MYMITQQTLKQKQILEQVRDDIFRVTRKNDCHCLIVFARLPEATLYTQLFFIIFEACNTELSYSSYKIIRKFE